MRCFAPATLVAVALVALTPTAQLLASAPSGTSPTPGAQGTASPRSVTARIATLEAERRSAVTIIRSLKSAGPEGRLSRAAADRLSELEQRVRALEAEIRLLRAEALRRLPGTQTPADAAGLEPVSLFEGQDPQGGQVTAGTAFNPSITVIPDGVYWNDNRAGSVPEIVARTEGFAVGGKPAADGHSHGGGLEPGFNLRELEVSFSGSVDPYFDVWTTLAVGGGEVEAEEAYVQTRRLLPGLQVRFGKFYSGIGYSNRQHPHQWDFVDQALPYALLLGGTLNEVGVQVNWLPALPLYTLIGFEALQGENPQVASHLAPEADAAFRDAAGPRLFTGFLKVSPEIGYSHALQFGASAGRSRLHQEQAEDAPGQAVSLDGTATFVLGDVIYRYDSGKQYGLGDVSLQAEYLRRWKDLDVVSTGAGAGERRQLVQDGLYAQVVHGFAERWTTALRFEVAGLANEAKAGGRVTRYSSSRRYAANLTFNPTEFSRLRVQAARGDVRVLGGRERYNELFVQFQMSLGAHGAHRW